MHFNKLGGDKEEGKRLDAAGDEILGNSKVWGGEESGSSTV